jgi:UDP-N-acetylmuramoyl-tripeptide--D-alanyl-D-alanine ligase
VFRPDIAVVLTVLLDHYSAFRTLENVAREKATLLRHVRPGGVVYLNADDALVAAMKAPEGVKVITFGRGPEADICAWEAVSAWPQRLRFRVKSRQGSGLVETQMVGQHFLTPVLAATAVGLGLGYAFEDVAAALFRFPGYPARMHPLGLPGGITVLRDEYKSSPHTVSAAFDELRRASARRKVLVFGDMADTSMSKRDRQKKVAKMAAEVFDMLFFVGEHASYAVASAIRSGIAPDRTRGFASVSACADFLRGELAEGDLVLLKGTNNDHLSRIAFRLVGSARCDRSLCEKKMLCDTCPELGADEATLSQVRGYPACKADSTR